MTRSGSETILLADDEDTVKRVAIRILAREGYTVLAASNGAEALKIAESHEGPIHLLLTDLMMPDMNGAQLAEQLRAVRPELPTLFLSGYTDASMVRQGPLHPSEHFLQKPFARDTLVNTVRGILDAPLRRPGDQ